MNGITIKGSATEKRAFKPGSPSGYFPDSKQLV